MASLTSNASPWTNRSAVTLPSRYLAARSGRAGVSRRSSIAFAQQFVDCPGGLAFAAFGAPWLCRWRPAINIDMQPLRRRLDKALQKQRADDRSGKAAGRRVVNIGGFRIQPGIVSRPQRHSPQRIVFRFGATRDVVGKPLIIAVERRQ